MSQPIKTKALCAVCVHERECGKRPGSSHAPSDLAQHAQAANLYESYKILAPSGDWTEIGRGVRA